MVEDSKLSIFGEGGGEIILEKVTANIVLTEVVALACVV